MPKAKTHRAQTLCRTPYQLYVIIKILKDKSLINEYLYDGPECSRGHTKRRQGEDWCFQCACSILSGNCGTVFKDLIPEFQSPYNKWTLALNKKDLKSCWPVATTSKNNLFRIPNYWSKKKKTKNQDDIYAYLTIGKVANTYYWGDIGSLTVSHSCMNRYCGNPLHVYSIFNYPSQPVDIRGMDKLDGRYKHDYFGELTKTTRYSVHEYTRCLLSESFREEYLYEGFYCPWGHTKRSSNEQWCFECVERILSGKLGHDSNYLINIYRHIFEETFKGLKRGEIDDCWILPEDRRKSVYKLPSYDYETSKQPYVSLPKFVYTAFWGDVGTTRIIKSCKEKWCWNPAHHRTVFNDPVQYIEDFKHCNFDIDPAIYTKIVKKRKQYARYKRSLSLPWQTDVCGATISPKMETAEPVLQI